MNQLLALRRIGVNEHESCPEKNQVSGFMAEAMATAMAEVVGEGPGRAPQGIHPGNRSTNLTVLNDPIIL